MDELLFADITEFPMGSIVAPAELEVQSYRDDGVMLVEAEVVEKFSEQIITLRIP